MPQRAQLYSEELKDEIRRRHEQGETIAELAAKTGIPDATIKCFVSTADRARSAKKLAERRTHERAEVCNGVRHFFGGATSAPARVMRSWRRPRHLRTDKGPATGTGSILAG